MRSAAALDLGEDADGRAGFEDEDQHSPRHRSKKQRASRRTGLTEQIRDRQDGEAAAGAAGQDQDAPVFQPDVQHRREQGGDGGDGEEADDEPNGPRIAAHDRRDASRAAKAQGRHDGHRQAVRGSGDVQRLRGAHCGVPEKGRRIGPLGLSGDPSWALFGSGISPGSGAPAPPPLHAAWLGRSARKPPQTRAPDPPAAPRAASVATNRTASQAPPPPRS